MMVLPITDSARVWGLNHRVLTNVLGDCVADLTALGLDAKEFFVLAELAECHFPAELAVRLVIPKPTITVYLKNLERAGLVRREIDEHDLRRHRLALTPKGVRVRQRALAVLSRRFDERLDRLSDKERRELVNLLEKLLD